MGIAAIAEGVETESQVAGLKMLGCEVAQGFYFSQPLRAGDFDELLTRHFAPVNGAATGPRDVAGRRAADAVARGGVTAAAARVR